MAKTTKTATAENAFPKVGTMKQVVAKLTAKPRTFKQICEDFGFSRHNVKYSALNKLVADGVLAKVEDGYYKPAKPKAAKLKKTKATAK
jgi:DNA-binding transcriptional regulator PaaX